MTHIEFYEQIILRFCEREDLRATPTDDLHHHALEIVELRIQNAVDAIERMRVARVSREPPPPPPTPPINLIREGDTKPLEG